MRPLKPSSAYVVPTFATGANYPAGALPWSATPIRVAPAGDYFEPEQGGGAQIFNHLFFERDQTSQELQEYLDTLLGYIGQMSAQNWPTPSTVGDATDATCAPYFNEKTGEWLTAGVASGTPRVYRSSDCFRSYSVAGDVLTISGADPSEYVTCLASSPTGRIIALTCAGVNGIFCYVQGPGSSTWTQSATAGASDHVSRFMFYFAGKLVSIGGDPGGGSSSASFMYSTDDGDTWTGYGVLPGAFEDQGNWVAAAGAGAIVAFAKTPGLTTFVRTVNGTSWTTGTISLGADETVQGVAWSDEDSCFLATSFDTVTEASRVWRANSTGAAFTLVATLPAYKVANVASCGSLWCIALENTPIVDRTRIAYSTDAGVSWKWTGFLGTTVAQSYLRSNGQQFVISTDAGKLAVSLATGSPELSL